MRTGRSLITATVVLVLTTPGCAVATGSPRARPPKVRVGYQPNLTHAPAIVGIERGLFTKALAGRGRLDTRPFNAGPDAVQALFSKALDIAYMGPNPTVNAHVQSDGQAIRVIAGATSGGAGLVVRPGITSPEDLRGATLSTPQLGNTQDVALRTWLDEHGLEATTAGDGDVSIRPQSNAQIFTTFAARQIDGAWVPEPWLSRLVVEAGGRLLVDEASLWPDGRFVTTNVVVRTAFLERHPRLVEAFLRAHLAALDLLNTSPGTIRPVVERAVRRMTGAAFPPGVLQRAWASLTFTHDPIAVSLRRDARDALRAGFLDHARLDGLYALGTLNELLVERSRPKVAA